MKEQEIVTAIKAKLEATFYDVPFIKSIKCMADVPVAGARIDLVVDLDMGKRIIRTFVECKSQGEPRIMRSAIEQVKEYMKGTDAQYGIVVAPYISEDTARICKENGVGYIDLAGNCYLCFRKVCIEKQNYPNPFIQKRQVRSIFSPKSSRILRVMLSNPHHSWQVQELAREARVSLGLASRVKERLLDLEYASENNKNVFLSRPRQLLQKWADNYSFSNNTIHNYRGSDEPQEVERKLSQFCQQGSIPYALTLSSATTLLAPSAGRTRGYAYVGQRLPEISRTLGLDKASSESNFALVEPHDEGVFYGSRTIDQMQVVGMVQLYLDLKGSDEGGAEAAEVLLEQWLESLSFRSAPE